MRIIRLLLLVILLAGALFAAQTYRQGGIAALQGLPSQAISAITSQNLLKIDQKQVESLARDPGNQLQTLAERSKEVGEHAGNIIGDGEILGETVEVNEEAPPIHERALEYGRYLYCQQVVEDYESQQEK